MIPIALGDTVFPSPVTVFSPLHLEILSMRSLPELLPVD